MPTLVILAAAAWAGLHPAREPLPAREVERPIVLPLGWTEVALDARAPGVTLAGRHGVARGVAVSAALDADESGLAATRIAAEVGLVWREPPALAWSAEIAWSQPWGEAPGTAEGRVRMRRAFGPMRADLSAGASMDGEGATSPLAEAALLAQIGPMWLESAVALADPAWTVWSGAAIAQLSRGASIGAIARLDARDPWLGARLRLWL